MSTDPIESKLAFSSRCLPGSMAEQKEKERLVEFHRCKALRKAEELRGKPESDARRQQVYLAACEANNERMHRRNRAFRTL